MSSYPADPCKNCKKISDLDNDYQTLISRITHEVRNPLTLIYSSIQLLEQEIPDISQSALWPQLKTDILDTIHLLKDISTLNRNSVSQQKTLSVTDLLEGISVSFSSFARERSVRFFSDFDESIQNRQLSGSAPALKEALWNLLLNAADALSSCNRQRRIILSAAAADQQLIIHVRDNGPGIPSEYLPTLFEPFVTHKSGGTGLGLSIARHAAVQHGGSLTVETKASLSGICDTVSDSFTDFCLTLPCHPIS